MIAEAVPCWLDAGQRALRTSANPEAIVHLTTGLDLLADLPRAQSATEWSCSST
jgi:predicted ATPase